MCMHTKYSNSFPALLLTLLVFSSPVKAESSWSWQHPYPTGSHINAVQFIDNSNGWIVTDWGEVFGTDDGGIIWEELYRLPGNFNWLKGVYFLNTNEGWACGEDGLLLHTIDAGVNWTSTTLSAYDLLSIEFSDENYGSIVGLVGVILRTMNGGDSWQTQGSGITVPIYDVSFVNPTTGWTTGSTGNVLHTETAGAFWEEQNTGLSVDYEGIHFIDEIMGFAVGDQYIAFTDDGGDIWTAAYQNTGTSFCDVDFAGNLGAASGMLGVAVTENEGTDWLYENMPEHPLWSIEPYLRSISVPSDSRIVASGNYGIIYSRDPAGIWNQLSSHKTLRDINGVTHFGENLVWACGENGVILASSDGGDYWEAQIIDEDYFLTDICFPSTTSGYCVGSTPSGGVILKTVNGGVSWVEITPSVPAIDGLRSVDFTNEDCGVAVGSYGEIVYTTDGGASWIEKNFGSTSLSRVRFGDTDRGWIVGGSGKIICFDFNSDSWSAQTSSMTQTFNGLFALNADTVWAVGWNGTVIQTLNMGLDWQTVAVTGLDYQDVWFDSNGLDGYFTGVEFGETSDGGYNITHSTYAHENSLSRISCIDMNNGWGCGNGGMILHYGEGSTGITEFNHSNPSVSGTDILSNPNPFSVSSIISFIAHTECLVTLDLYDMAGRKVQTLHSGSLPAGEHSLTLSGADLPPGLYYLRLAAGGIVETNSLIRLP